MESSEQKRIKQKHSAQFIADHPYLFPLMFYATIFFTVVLSEDILAFIWPGSEHGPNKYIFPLVLAIPGWLGLRSRSKRMILDKAAGP